ncbi:M50 family metallopeptidase [bacterium]|nr:M50 family metallopeptidase [bacterium]
MILLIFILILSTLVLIHEFGHFIVAKKNDIRVEEFGLGLPPRIWGKKIGETLYSINWLPFGGFVKLTGEDLEGKVDLQDPYSYASKRPAQRLAVLLAGVFMNFVLAVGLFYVLLVSMGFRSFYIPLFFNYDFRFGNSHPVSTVIAGISEESPLNETGAELGQAILMVDGVAVSNVDDVRRELSGKLGKSVEILVTDLKPGSDGIDKAFIVTPYSDTQGEAVLGVYLTSATYLSYDLPVERVFSGVLHAYNTFFYSTSTMGSLISASLQEHDLSPVTQSVAGPVGIYNIVGNIINYAGEDALLSLLDYTALMSLSLAFINLLPFPALDGGRTMFVLYELVTRKKPNPKVEARLHKWGMVLLLMFLALVTIKDIRL